MEQLCGNNAANKHQCGQGVEPHVVLRCARMAVACTWTTARPLARLKHPFSLFSSYAPERLAAALECQDNPTLLCAYEG